MTAFSLGYTVDVDTEDDRVKLTAASSRAKMVIRLTPGQASDLGNALLKNAQEVAVGTVKDPPERQHTSEEIMTMEHVDTDR
jgi:hypothetical protein